MVGLMEWVVLQAMGRISIREGSLWVACGRQQYGRDAAASR